MPETTESDPPGRPRLAEVARLFLRLGFTAFGGPAAHVALMEEEVVNRRAWLTRRDFLDLVSAVNFIPGPNSTELAIHLGYLRAGLPGLIVAGACFIVPAVLIVLSLAWCYVTFGATPAVGDALVGVKACMVAIVAVALWRFARTGVKDRFTAALAALALVAAALLEYFRVPQPELVVLGLAAVGGTMWYGRGGRGNAPPAPLAGAPDVEAVVRRSAPLPLLGLPVAAAAGASAAFSANVLAMGLFFLKVGATLFGSGYVLASFLHSGLVEQHRWLTERELLDAIAVGQVTPGPLLTAATFIGYLLGAKRFGGGVAGGVIAGVVATAAIFLPSFLFVSALGPILPRLQRSPRARGALDGMNAAVVALIAVVTVWLGRSVVYPGGHFDGLAVGIFAASLVALLATKVNATWLIFASGVIGWGVRAMG
jgi:chromate transporter